MAFSLKVAVLGSDPIAFVKVGNRGKWRQIQQPNRQKIAEQKGGEDAK